MRCVARAARVFGLSWPEVREVVGEVGRLALAKKRRHFRRMLDKMLSKWRTQQQQGEGGGGYGEVADWFESVFINGER